MWKTVSGKVLPITSGTPTLNGDGTFLVSAIVPSLLNGDAHPAETDAKIGIVLIHKKNGPLVNSTYTVFGDFPPPPAFRIKVQDPNGNPIPNAIVDLRGTLADLALKLDYEKSNGGKVSINVNELASQPNQILTFGNGTIFPTQNGPATCAASPVYGRTDANGIFQPDLPLQDWLATAGKKVYLGESYPGAYLVTPTQTTFTVNVTGQYQGFGEVANQVPVPWTQDLTYFAQSGAFYKEVNGQNVLVNTDPLVVTLQPVPAGTVLQKPVELTILGLTPLKKFSNYLGSGIPLTAFGKFWGFPNLTDYPNPIFLNPPAGLVVQFDYSTALYGLLDMPNVTLTIDNATYPFTTITSDQCNTNLNGNLTYRATIPQPHRLAPGSHLGLVQVKDQSNPPTITKRYIIIDVAAPPGWFQDPALKNRTVFYNSYFSMLLKGDALAPGDPASTSTLGANLNKVGQVDNAAGATATYSQWLGTSGASARQFDSAVNYEAVNNPNSKSVSQGAASSAPITFQEGPITILNTGKKPLFRDVWGIPPIASATIGADMWFKATLSYSGTIQTNGPGGTTAYTITVDPEANIGVDAWLDASALLGLVDAQAHAIPSISVSLPVTMTNGSITDIDKCFKFRLDIAWEASVGYCPLCVSDSGTKTIFADHVPHQNPTPPPPHPVCSDPPAPDLPMQPAVSNPGPPDSSPSLAVDGVGNVMAVWRADDGTLKYSRYSGIQWLTPGVVSANTSSGAPQVAFYAPDKAVAVWTQNGLTPAQAQTASFETKVLNQHLMYAVWNGSVWSAAQNLTAATTGDGAVVLAGCLSTNSACPSGGTVSAVWVHNSAGDLSQLQLRLKFATFHNGAWTGVQDVDPANSTMMDSEPALVYQNGLPLVAWVRDADRDLGTLNDRLLVTRLLSGPTSVLPTNLPAGIVEPSLAVNPAGNLRLAFTLATDASGLSGNQRQLYSAAQSCAGSCTWSVQGLVDGHGRAIHAEGPQLTINGSGKGTILYRGLGMGPLPGGGQGSFSEDAPGIIQGTGEVSKVEVNFAAAAVTPMYLTQDGTNKWQVNAVYDPLSEQTLVTAAVAGGGLMPQSLGVGLAISQGEPVMAAAVPELPDYVLDEAVPSAVTLPPGTSLSLAVGVVNQGLTVGQSLSVAAAWDGPPGTGLPAGSALIDAPSAGERVTASLDIDTRAVDLSQVHDLYVAVNPGQSPAEVRFDNNASLLAIGGLPAPTGLAALVKPGSSIVFLNWTAPLDSRVVGYRVYRFEDDGRTVFPVGSTFEADFADLWASLDTSYQYALTSFDDQGQELALSDKVDVQTESLKIYLPVIRSER